VQQASHCTPFIKPRKDGDTGHDDRNVEGAMSRHNGTKKTQRPRAKPQFYDLCKMYELDYDDLLDIANKASVTKEVIDAMFLGDPVKRTEAVAVLGALSERVPDLWMLSDTRIPTLEDK
jgi:hypothetical protein